MNTHLIYPQPSTGAAIRLSEREFNTLKDFIYRECGIHITDAKKTMLEARLLKRLKSLNFSNFTDYCNYLLSPEGKEEELPLMINQVTTNKTDFFREPGHFDYLVKHVLPTLESAEKPVTIWSAGCSTGEEPYTLAMMLKEYGRGPIRDDFLILATDISTRVLEKARLAIYDMNAVSQIPSDFQRKYLLRSKDRSSPLFRVKPEVRRHIRFRRLNFMDDDFGFREKMDVIFCRNVIIYFDKPTQERLLNKFCHYLAPDGHIFMGHSETLFGMKIPLALVAPTIYRRVS
jgi:chemotaxis protein methyltransferase CheR